MKKIYYFVFVLGIWSCSGNSSNSDSDPINPLEDVKVDEIHYFYHQVKKDSQEFLSETNDQFLMDFIHGEAYKEEWKSKISYYYNHQNYITNADEIKPILNLFKVRSKDARAEETKCAPTYNDIFILYYKGNYVGIVKICFECSQFHVSIAGEEDDYWGNWKMNYGMIENYLVGNKYREPYSSEYK